MTMGDTAPSTAAGSTRRAVTAFFDERAAAQAAIDDLVAAGVPRADVALVEGSGAAPIPVDAVPSPDKSVWDRVRDLFMADEDRHAYGEGLRRGGFLLSVTTTPGNHDEVVALLDREGSVDMDARGAGSSKAGTRFGPRRIFARRAVPARPGNRAIHDPTRCGTLRPRASPRRAQAVCEPTAVPARYATSVDGWSGADPR